MGIYRYILAVLVLLSHFGIYFFGYNQGVSAVVSFFMISGYVITLLIKKHYSSRGDILSFYLDRALRLFPQFLFYLMITVIIFIIYNEKTYLTGAAQVFTNITMLPLNFFAVYDDNFILIPQAWSLGLELQFYILIPIILIFKAESLVLKASIALASFAYVQIFNADYFGYRMITGTLFIFIIGTFLTDVHSNKKEISLTYLFMVAVFFLSIHIDEFKNSRTTELSIGFIFGLPLVLALNKLNIKSFTDRLLGNLSYGVYLNHNIIIFLMKKFGYFNFKFSEVIFLILVSTSMSYVTFKFIESPCYKLRHKVRRRYEGKVSTPKQIFDQ